jgi:hypothetical protein
VVRNVSKGIVTTNSLFAPGVFDEFRDEIPYRLELRDRKDLLSWISKVNEKKT